MGQGAGNAAGSAGSGLGGMAQQGMDCIGSMGQGAGNAAGSAGEGIGGMAQQGMDAAGKAAGQFGFGGKV